MLIAFMLLGIWTVKSTATAVVWLTMTACWQHHHDHEYCHRTVFWQFVGQQESIWPPTGTNCQNSRKFYFSVLQMPCILHMIHEYIVWFVMV